MIYSSHLDSRVKMSQCCSLSGISDLQQVFQVWCCQDGVSAPLNLNTRKASVFRQGFRFTTRYMFKLSPVIISFGQRVKEQDFRYNRLKLSSTGCLGPVSEIGSETQRSTGGLAVWWGRSWFFLGCQTGKKPQGSLQVLYIPCGQEVPWDPSGQENALGRKISS